MTLQWMIFLTSLDPTIGSEQAGRRPVLVVSCERLNHLLPVVNVLPLPSRKAPTRMMHPNEALIPAGMAGLNADSIVLCYQIRTLDKRRLEHPLGQLQDNALRAAIREALRFQLAMEHHA